MQALQLDRFNAMANVLCRLLVDTLNYLMVLILARSHLPVPIVLLFVQSQRLILSLIRGVMVTPHLWMSPLLLTALTMPLVNSPVLPLLLLDPRCNLLPLALMARQRSMM